MSKTLIIVLCALIPAIAQAAECRYLSRQSGKGLNPEISPQGECGKLIGQDGFRIYPKHLKNLFFKNGIAEVFVGDKVFYVSESGKAVRTHMFDNGADYFSEGLARTISRGKFGYIDGDLNIVVRPEYDFAFPFAGGIAVVCNGCRLKEDGEHQAIAGGKWGLIDKSGRTVVPVKYGREELESKAEYKRFKKKKAE